MARLRAAVYEVCAFFEQQKHSARRRLGLQRRRPELKHLFAVWASFARRQIELGGEHCWEEGSCGELLERKAQTWWWW